jgi:hypothetical protein
MQQPIHHKLQKRMHLQTYICTESKGIASQSLLHRKGNLHSVNIMELPEPQAQQ